MIRKTGILGGTFDPVHKGHLELAIAAKKLCGLSEVVLLPAASPPHKQNRNVADFSHRVAMLNCAVSKYPALQTSTIEHLLPFPSYTIDTIEYLQLHSVGPVEFYFITGADAFLDILSWKEYQKILTICHFIVFSREGHTILKLKELVFELGFKKRKNRWKQQKSGKSIYISSESVSSISSSKIRKQIAAGKSVNKTVPKKVLKYIEDHALYR